MKNRINSLLTGLLILVGIGVVQAEIKLPAIVSSNMVLQRNTTVQVWGWADAGETISITASWINDAIETKTDDAGKWSAAVRTTNSKDPQGIVIVGDGSRIALENLLFGEVWLCSGQSNMQQPLGGYTGQPTYGGAMATLKSNNTNLRLFSVDRVGSKTPQEDIAGYTGWQQASPKNVMDFSAIAYYYGQQLQEILDVPVGMIHTSWGGSSVEAWISKEMISNYQEVDLTDVDIEQRTNHIPTALYNSMIYPLISYNIKGVLWYQGESNRTEPDNYKELFPAMVKDWRAQWGIGDFPFYYVQIAPYLYGGNTEFQGVENSAFIREVQLQCVDLIPNSGIAIAMDIGEEHCIHPPKKKEIADRLLYNALNQTYGFDNIDFEGPVFDTKESKDGGLMLKFKNAETGLYAYGDLEGFEIAGADKVFHPAEASIVSRRDLMVKSAQVSDPVAVRYAWRNWVIGTLYDSNLLPASSFRTDEWDDATQVEE